MQLVGIIGAMEPEIAILKAQLSDMTTVKLADYEFYQGRLADTDRRVAEGKPVAPSFLLACLLWHDVLDHWKRNQARGEPTFPALQSATDAVFDARIGDISGRGKLASDMREIWTMQPRFDKRVGSGPLTLVEQPRFRAGFDFLRLRAQTGEADQQLATWWEDFSLADNDERRELMDVARQQESAKRAAQGPRTGGRSASHAGAGAGSGAETPVFEDGGESAAPAAKKRRRRRRKPGEGEGGAVDTHGAPGDGGGSGD